MTVRLANPSLSVTIDPAFGAEICSIVEQRSGTELLMQTPWAEAARLHRRPGFSFNPDASALEWWARYGGGWQIMLPHAGVSEPDDGFDQPFHGEACVQAWRVEAQSEVAVELSAPLITTPITARRRIGLEGARLTVTDRLVNPSHLAARYMCLHHPAYSAPFLGPRCTIATSARYFAYDPNFMPVQAALGEPLPWPRARDVEAGEIRLDQLPPPRSGAFRFGYLAEFGADPWYEIRNPELGIGIRMSWPEGPLTHAWLLQEAGGSQGFPWRGEGFVFAIEPATCATGGPGRVKRILMPGAEETLEVRFDLIDLRP